MAARTRLLPIDKVFVRVKARDEKHTYLRLPFEYPCQPWRVVLAVMEKKLCNGFQQVKIDCSIDIIAGIWRQSWLWSNGYATMGCI